MTHPSVEQVENFGYPLKKEEKYYGTDELGNEVFHGDDIYELNDEYFLIETLTQDSKELLQILGAEKRSA
ncbi:hypothetical protein [Halobacillus sp. A5]|uniref:hypothetical protein n=1 Tax=Halobacillus sp. A5 TaxID=2880263 RepID=UPI0020A67EDE|nr:hypothetical protein [Halobacillus sp. A5]MCP3026639.1 hypothetical protein [Halobacillus sp. A5]